MRESIEVDGGRSQRAGNGAGESGSLVIEESVVDEEQQEQIACDEVALLHDSSQPQLMSEKKDRRQRGANQFRESTEQSFHE